MSNIIWARFGTSLMPVKPYVQENVGQGIYSLRMNPSTRELYITKVGDKFNLPPKIYNIEGAFIKKAVAAWHKTNKNIGILLNGFKGGGKTMTAKLIANEIDVPVIMIDYAYESLPDIISQITFDCIIFIDEYEKIFSNDERGILLSVMDGTKTQTNKIMFLLTTNTMRVNENLINRPSRIRYVKEYRDLPKHTIEEIVDDLLTNKNYREDAIKIISELESVTMDSVIEIIKESNLHNESPSNFINYFNVGRNRSSYKYKLVRVDNESETYDVQTKSSLFPTCGITSLSTIAEIEGEKIHIGLHIKSHTANGNLILVYPNPLYSFYCEKIDNLEDTLRECSDENEKLKIEDEIQKVRSDRDGVEKVITAEFKYIYSFDKNWMYTEI